MKEHTKSWYKKKAKSIFQKYIRIVNSDDSGYVRCVTCGSVNHYKKMDAGHFIPATYLSTCFEEMNVHPQCKRCNKFLEGNRDQYFLFMERTYGRDAVDDLIARKNNLVKYHIGDYQEIIDKYTDMLVGREIE